MALLSVEGSEELAVEAEGYAVRHLGASPLGERRGIEHEQEGPLARWVEHHRQRHPVVLAVGARARHEHRLARPGPVLAPDGGASPPHVELDQPVEEAAARARAVHGAIGPSVVAGGGVGGGAAGPPPPPAAAGPRRAPPPPPPPPRPPR